MPDVDVRAIADRTLDEMWRRLGIEASEVARDDLPTIYRTATDGARLYLRGLAGEDVAQEQRLVVATLRRFALKETLRLHGLAGDVGRLFLEALAVVAEAALEGFVAGVIRGATDG